MRKPRSPLPWGLVFAPLVLVLVASSLSCSKSSTTAPFIPADDVNALPVVPEPSAPHTTPPLYSASTFVLRPHTGDFNPLVPALTGHWKVYVHQIRWTPPAQPCDGPEKLAYEGDACCHDLPNVSVRVEGCGLLNDQTHTFECSPTAYPKDPFVQRFALMVNGGLQVPPLGRYASGKAECLTGVGDLCFDAVGWAVRHEVTGRQLQRAPYLLRERFWERVPMDDQGLEAVWLSGDNTFDVTTTYRTGCDSAASNSFAKSLKIGAEGTFEWLKVSVEATITKTFTTSVTLSQSQERSYSKHLVGDAGKITCHTLWSLVDQYRWSDGGKALYTDPNYQFTFGQADARGRPVELEVRGQQLFLMKSTFDQNGVLERSELLAAL